MDERKAYQDILHFLNVGDVNFAPLPPYRNPSRALRFVRLRKFLFSHPVKKWLYTNTPKGTIAVWCEDWRKIFKKEQEKPRISEDNIIQLKIRFKSKVEDLNSFFIESKLLNRNLLTLWNY